jgi:hypothetical protein
LLTRCIDTPQDLTQSVSLTSTELFWKLQITTTASVQERGVALFWRCRRAGLWWVL